jgi:hypothetical protein
MADIYCDMDLTTGANDGTSWTDAYRTLQAAWASGATAAGDKVWVKGTQSHSGSNVDLSTDADIWGDRVEIIGCKSATTATPPAASDIIPGLATGDTDRAYDDADVPTFTITDTSDLTFRGVYYCYGIKFVTGTGGNNWDDNDGYARHEECEFETSRVGNSGGSGRKEFINCADTHTGSGGQTWSSSAGGLWQGCVLTNSAGVTNMFSDPRNLCQFEGCDLSDAAHVLLSATSLSGGKITLRNCTLHASFVFQSGSFAGHVVIESFGSDSSSGKTSGSSVQAYDYVSNEGDVVEETTAVRTGGADDGADGGFSYALTPNINETAEPADWLTSPEMMVWVAGDGTSKTLTCYIANSGAADYNNDDVWLEALYPSEAGTAQHDYESNRMVIKGTPTAVTDDASSTWGTGGNNPQKLELTIAPDYEGIVYARVKFAKRFASSPETLYVDPRLEVA